MSDLQKRASAPKAEVVAPPILMRWDGEHMAPVGRFASEADRYYTIGQTYRLVEHFDRSGRSHRHEFSVVREAWENLPEHLAERFETPEKLRKFALCKAGFCESKVVVCPSKAFAIELFRKFGPDYDWAVIDGNAVTFFTAHSQAYFKANRERFQAQKDGLLAVLADLIGVSPETLAANTNRAA